MQEDQNKKSPVCSSALYPRVPRHTLPLVEMVCASYNLSLEDICIIGAQHILPTTLRMLNSLFNRGLEPKNVSLIGKCYSTDFSTYHEMIHQGIDVCPSSYAFIKNESFDETYKKNLENFFHKISTNFFYKKEFKKIILLDDGGELLKNVNFFINRTKMEHCSILGIEQTSSGFEKIKDVHFSFPIINVARCNAKLKYESPLIAATTISQLGSKLNKMIVTLDKALIIGNGAIGSAFAHILNSSYDIDVDMCDLKPTPSVFGFDELDNILPKYDIVVGCTGKTILNNNNYKYLKEGAILLSLSSSDREFAAVNLRREYKGPLDCHSDFNVHGLRILNCGFPLNFYGNADITDPEVFQLTRSLLVAAIMTGLTTEGLKNGISPLEEEMQKKIISFHRDN